MLKFRKLLRFLIQKRLYSAVANTNGKNNLIVQKFGGTSLGTPNKMRKVVDIIKQFNKDSNIITVVSALSSDIKAEGTTSRLLKAADLAVKKENYGIYLDKIEDTHLDITYSLLKSRELRDEVRQFISNELKDINQFCNSLGIIKELSPRSQDKIIGCGERLSAGLLTFILKDLGFNAKYIDLSTIFDDLNTNIHGYESNAKNKIKTMFINDSINMSNNNDNCIPIVTGFIGHVKGGIMESLSRGYSDFTAALCAGAVDAKMLQVWKESAGVFTANPTKISNANLLKSVTPDEANELTYFGNEVLHPYTMKSCIEDKVLIEILNTFEPNEGGTIINPDNGDDNDIQTSMGMKAVCSKKGVNVINFNSNNYSHNWKVFELLDKYDIKADLISTSVCNISVAIHESISMSHINNLIKELNKYGECILDPNKAIVSCIGSKMKHQIGTAAKVFQCLSDSNINIEMISQGSSEINMSVVISQNDVDKAVEAIHNTFIKNSLQKQET